VSAPFICHIGFHHYQIWWWQTWFHWTLWPQNLAKDTKVISIVHFLGELWMILCYGGRLGRHLEFHPFCQTEIQTVHPIFFYLPRGVLPGSRVKMRGHLIAHRTPWAPGLDPRVMPSVPEFFKCQIFIIQLCGQLLRYSLGWQQPIVGKIFYLQLLLTQRPLCSGAVCWDVFWQHSSFVTGWLWLRTFEAEVSITLWSCGRPGALVMCCFMSIVCL